MTPIDRPIIILGVTLVLASQVHLLFYIGTIIMTLDMVARYRDYLWLRRCGQFQRGIAYHMRGSWCSRGVVECVWGHKARDFYRILGYRWYHILPDDFPKVFLNPKFWVHVFGLYRR